MEVECYSLNGEKIDLKVTTEDNIQKIVVSDTYFDGAKELHWFDPDFYLNENISIRIPLSREFMQYFKSVPVIIYYK